MWSHLPLKGMMVMMFGRCEANTMVLLTRSLPLSLSMQVAFTNGHCEVTFASIKLLFYWRVPILYWRISLSIMAHVMEPTMVIWNACLLTQHTYNWMMVRPMMRITTKIRLMRLALLTFGGLRPWMKIVVLKCRCVGRFIRTHGSNLNPFAWNNGQDQCGMYLECKCWIVQPCNIISSRSWIKHSPPLFCLSQRIHAPKNGISLGGWWV
jgi:hypothetical protein